MLSSERRGSSARRGMTVLGKIPAVPKPINLPSQRLENRGLDPNVEIVPRGSVSWGSAGRSPPTSVNAWGAPSQASSPPGSSGAWGPKVGASSVGSSSSISGGSTFGGPGNIPRPTSGGSGTRPSSGGGGSRPLSGESRLQQSSDSYSSNANASSAWGARPSSASGVLGQAQPQLGQAQAQARPRSADITRPNRSLSEFGDESGSQSPAGNAAWGNRGPPRRLGEEPHHQVSRFQLTRTDFPTLGSEKNPDLRPQQGSSGADRGASVETKGGHPEERRPPTPPGPHEDIPPMPPSGGGYGHPERGAAENRRREGAAFQGPPPAAEGNWHRDGPSARPSFGGQGPQPDSWRREAAPSGGPADDNWRRGGAPPVGQYGPPPGPGHYPHEGPGFMHQPRFGPGPAAFGRGAPGPGGYGHPGDMYGNAGPLLRPGGPMHPMRPNMFQGPVPYDGFYGPPGPGYQGMEDPERMMMGMGGGPYGGFAQHRGPPPEAFGRFPHGGMNQGPRHPPNSNLRERERERGEPVGEGYHEGQNYHKEGSEGPGHKDGRGYNERYGGGPGPGQEGGDNRRGGGVHRGAANSGDGHGQGQGQRGMSSGHQGGHRDWGAAASSDEPMDFSKPVFEEEVVSASPNGSGKQSPAPGQHDEASVEEVKREDVRADANSEKSVVEVEAVKDEEKKVVVASKSDSVGAHRSLEGSSMPKGRSEGGDVAEGRDQVERKVQNVVEKEAVVKIVTKEGPGKWERSSKRAESHTREVIGPAASGAPLANLRSGQYSTKSSILGNAPRNAAPDVAAAPQILQHPSQEKPSAASAPVASEAEVPKAVEKGRILRRPESPKVESGSMETGGTGVSDVSASQPAAAVHEGSGKEGLKPKGKASSHDGEKEWRPKVPIAEASPRPSVAAVAQVSKAGAGPATSGTETPEENNTDSESGPAPGSYDYDAQRAKMKEIAAQRARQLQKEEEERIREQKAKARAKLEELDRRSTVVPESTGEDAVEEEVPKAAVEVEEAQAAEEIPAVEAEPALQSGSSTGSTKRGVRNEHGKRERDRKANSRKAGAGEGAKAKVNGTPSQGSAILPPPMGPAAPLLTTPLPVPEVYGQHASSQREPRQRGRPEKKQVVAKGEESERGVASAGAPVDIPPPAANGGWSMDAPLPLPRQEVDSANTIHPTSEASGSIRKSKNSRNSRNRPRAEAAPIMAESIQFGDIPAFHTMVGGEQAVDAGVGAFHMDVGKDSNSMSNVCLSGDALTGDEGSAVSANGDASSKRAQRKSRGARRGPARSERGSQDQRAGEKSHGGDSMVWAPVRSPGAAGGNKVEGGHMNEQQKEESSSAQQQARAKRAEMERYTPKPLQKQQESWDQPAGPAGHQHTQGAQNQSSQGGVAAAGTGGESPRVGSVAEVKQVSSGDPKSNHDTKAAESGTKGVRSHGSWRQRGSGSERVTESAKDGGGPGAANPSGPGHGDSGHPRHRSEQKSGGGQAASRRNQAASDHVPATPQSTPVAPASGAGAGAGAPPVPPAAPSPAPASVQVSEREHPADKKLYQPPRPASAPAHRGQDHRVQDERGQENRGQEQRGQDYRGQDHRGHEHRGQGPRSSEQKVHDQGAAGHHFRHSNAPSDRPGPSENAGYQQQHRNGGGHHPRGQNVEKREDVLGQQAYVAPHSQQKPQPTSATKEASHPVSRERESQQQQASRGSSQHSAEGGEQGPREHRGRSERDQAARPSSGSQRGQGQWQQTGGSEGFRAAPSRPHPQERDVAGGPHSQSGRVEAPKQHAGDSQRAQQADQAGQQQGKAPQQTAPVVIPSPKVDSGSWEGAGGSPPVMRGRDYNHGGRRGRFGGRPGPRNTEMEHRRDPPSTKQRLVIDATGDFTNK